jgi:hypothetical protein
MWFYRRLLRVKRTDKRTNESVLKELGVQRLMLSEISKRRLRPPTSYIDNVKADSGLQLYEVIHQNRDWDRWRPVVARSGA